MKNIGGIKLMGRKTQKTKVLREKPIFCHLTITNPTQNVLGPNVGFGGDKLVTSGGDKLVTNRGDKLVTNIVTSPSQAS